MNKYEELQTKLKELNLKNDWDKHHNIKDLIIAVNVEAGELLEHALWTNEIIINQDLKYEIADIYIYLLHLCNKLGLDINDLALDKTIINEQRFEKSEDN